MKKKNVIAIGIFDGVHLGHKKILKAAVKIAKKNRTKALAVTFYPHPLSVLHPGNAPPSLISLKHRLSLIENTGIDRCIVINFTKKFAGVSAGDFVKNILLEKFNAGWVVIGEDFCFGACRKGDHNLLEKEAKKSGFKVARVKALKYRGAAVSSSILRQLIQKGRLGLAENLLGRPVAVLGTVVKGNALGRVLGFPTANINPHHEVVPPSGVYAVKVNLDKKYYNGILNIGIRPTFYGLNKQDKEPTIEVFIFNFSKMIYGKDIEALFVKKLRKEKKFKEKEDLIEQIKKDIKEAELALWRRII